MSAIHDLIGQIDDPRLRERLRTEWASASQNKKFGLVFEDHLPELLPLYRAHPRRGDLVCKRGGPLTDLWQVRRISDGFAICVKPKFDAGTAKAPSEKDSAAEKFKLPVAELFVVRQFGEPIFPSLVPVDAVQNGPADAPWHALIEADNYHALQLLDYLYAGLVDCIYIDPPYNSGARDWKYNNDYVDGVDSWRHSKWLAFMERRLILAKRLLKPDIGVLIVTIDEHEVHHLGMLLERVFPEFVRQMVTVVINPKGTGKLNFSRVEEQALYCIPDVEGGVIKGVSSSEDDDEIDEDDMSHLDPTKAHLWELRHARRRGSESSYRHQRWNQFYPLYIDEKAGTVLRSGASIPLEEEPNFRKIEGLTPIWPIDHDGNHRCWRFISTKMQSLIDRKRVVLGKFNRKQGTWTINIWERKPSTRKLKTVWWETSHDAGTHGTTLLHNVLGVRGAFAFPKSVYAVRDAISAVVADRPNALIVDFFAGSGTTLNAINLLNTADGGQRRCILVTNNEVSAQEAESMRARGLQSGEDDWEAVGICRSVTWPRSKFTICGQRDDGTVLSGDYVTGKTIEKAKARNFTQIGFAEPAALLALESDSDKRKREAVKLQKQVVALINGLPQTLVTERSQFIVSEDHKATILFDTAAGDDWLAALDEQDHITDFYIVTTVKKVFDGLKAQVNDLLGPLLVSEDEKRPMSAGFAANLAYFKLEFLDKDRVALKRAFREILPLLWLKAGAVGVRPELQSSAKKREHEPPVFIPDGTNFAVLLDEGRLAKLLQGLRGRTGLSHVFIVTDADESFKAIAAEVVETLGAANPGIRVVQLYRDYLVNFMINKGGAK